MEDIKQSSSLIKLSILSKRKHYHLRILFVYENETSFDLDRILPELELAIFTNNTRVSLSPPGSESRSCRACFFLIHSTFIQIIKSCGK